MSSEARGGRQLTDQEKEAISDILTRAGLSYLKDNFLREKVRILVLLNMYYCMWVRPMVWFMIVNVTILVLWASRVLEGELGLCTLAV